MTRRGLLPQLPLFTILLIQLSHRAVADADEGKQAGRLVNIDTASTTPKGAASGSLDVRFLTHSEDIVYSSLGGQYGLTTHLEIGVRAVTGATRTFTAGNGSIIRHGGQDVEVFGKVGMNGPRGSRLALLAGVSLPATPAQNQAAGTVSAVGELSPSNQVTLYLNPRAVFLKSNSIVGVGVGASIRLSDRLHVVGDWTGIASGDNTLSTADGSRVKRDLWGVALRFTTGTASQRFDLDLGFGNATGSTTGSSLTPGLCDASGFYFALRAHP